MRVIAIMNQQQGVGKTTAALNLAHVLAHLGFKVMVVDMDPDMGLTRHLKLSSQNQGLDSVMLKKTSFDEVALMIRDNLEFVAAGPDLSDVEKIAGGGVARGRVLQQALTESTASKYDFVLLDCASYSGLLAMNALLAAQEVLLPLKPSARSVRAIMDMLDIIKQFGRAWHRDMRLWLVITHLDKHNQIMQEINNKIRNVFQKRVLSTDIQAYPQLQKVGHAGKTLLDYQDNNDGAVDYQALAEDLLWGRTS